MLILAWLLVLILALAVIAAAGISFWFGSRVERERQRVAGEARLAEWRVREVTNAAIKQMMSEARNWYGRAE